jgi:hypothetical protein
VTGPQDISYRRNKCHCHGGRSETGPMHVTSDEAPQSIEYAYVLDDGGVTVLRGLRDRYVQTGRFSWERVHAIAKADAPAGEADVTTAGCGTDFEFCGHYAWVHFAEVDRDNRLSTRQWLGHDPLDIDEAVGVVDASGRRFDVTRSGRMTDDGVWISTGAVDADTGEVRDLPTRRLGGDGGWKALPGMTYVLPATAAGSSRTISADDYAVV